MSDNKKNEGIEVSVQGKFIGFAKTENNEKVVVFKNFTQNGEKQDKKTLAIVPALEFLFSTMKDDARKNFFDIGKKAGKSEEEIISDLKKICDSHAMKYYGENYANPPTLEELRKKHSLELSEDEKNRGNK